MKDELKKEQERDDELFFGAKVDEENKKSDDVDHKERDGEIYFGAKAEERKNEKVGASAGERTKSEERNDEIRYGAKIKE